MGYLESIAQYFETGDKPSEAEFLEFFSKIWWRDQLIPVASISTLQDQLNELASPIEKFIIAEEGVPFVYTVPAGRYLQTVIINPALNCSPYCKYSSGVDIIPEDPGVIVTPADGTAWDVSVLAVSVDKQIKLYNLPIDTVVYFIKRKLP